jgi:hypothetical protein
MLLAQHLTPFALSLSKGLCRATTKLSPNGHGSCAC